MPSLKWVLMICFIPFFVFSQVEDKNMKKKAFHTVINTLISHSVNEEEVTEIELGAQVFLDAREKQEFEISKIESARFVGYDSFDIKSVEDLDKGAEIVVYCSIGYRSEKVAEKLVEAGFTNVSNLYGGIFEWYNEGMPVVDSLDQETNRVHGYGKLWGKWLNTAEVVYD